VISARRDLCRRGSGRVGVGFKPMLALAIHMSPALGQTLALLATFLGIGVIVNVLIVYIVGLVRAEHRQNQERQRSVE
jgi:hypothetical protein